jgi:hypothetical protein
MGGRNRRKEWTDQEKVMGGRKGRKDRKEWEVGT